MLTYSNRGMYLECVLDRTCTLVKDRYDDFYFEKREIPTKIIKSMDKGLALVKLTSKSTLDYFGFIQGKYFEFEAKETERDYFDFNLIKEHQLKHMEEMDKHMINCFLVINFKINNEFYLVPYNALKDLAKKGKKIPLNEIKKNSLEIYLKFPGILDLREKMMMFYD